MLDETAFWLLRLFHKPFFYLLHFIPALRCLHVHTVCVMRLVNVVLYTLSTCCRLSILRMLYNIHFVRSICGAFCMYFICCFKCLHYTFCTNCALDSISYVIQLTHLMCQRSRQLDSLNYRMLYISCTLTVLIARFQSSVCRRFLCISCTMCVKLSFLLPDL